MMTLFTITKKQNKKLTINLHEAWQQMSSYVSYFPRKTIYMFY
jgi:hypothetical protein